MDPLASAAVWLRDNCHCGLCLDPRNGQKLIGLADIPVDVGVAGFHRDGDLVTVEFTPDGHRGVLPADLLSGALVEDDGRTEDSKELWDATDLADRLPVTGWADYLAEPAPLLNAVRRLGFGLLRGTPVEPGTVLEIVSTFGYVRTTNYGALFDVRVEPSPTNLAFTGLAIGPHTDNPYRDPVPTLQLLHCLRNAATGGESGLVDGFRAAARLRHADPAAFDLLARTPVTFAWSDATTSLRARRAMIGVDPLGRIREVRFNNRSLRPISGDAAAQQAFYRAYRAFHDELSRPDAMVTFTLAPGDCVIFDNTRLLHARTAFAVDGVRHLQGCYADIDALQSIVEV